MAIPMNLFVTIAGRGLASQWGHRGSETVVDASQEWARRKSRLGAGMSLSSSGGLGDELLGDVIEFH
jgi:hypothetical protein